jgi:hypothetical protein
MKATKTAIASGSALTHNESYNRTWGGFMALVFSEYNLVFSEIFGREKTKTLA